MCTFPQININQIKAHPFPRREKKGMPSKAHLGCYKAYLIKKVEDALPDFLPTKRLFKEITDQGYRGSFSTLRGFLCTIRKQAKMARKTSLRFHKDYLIKRVEDAVSEFVPTKQLLKEIRARGYQGSLRRLQAFLSTIRKQERTQKKTSLCFHKDYLIKRIEDALPEFVPTKQLFKEITDQGYRGTLQTLSGFLFRQHKKEQPTISLDFYKDYITERIQKAWPEHVSSKQIFEEIKAREYQGNIGIVERFLSNMHKSMSSEKFLQFHKNYILKRVKETCPDYLSTKQIFEEITARGYRGSVRTLQAFLSTNRKKSETSLERHKDYLMQKVGRYQGSLSMPQRFLSEIPQKKEAFLQFHKDYLIRKVEKLSPDCVSAKQLFEDMTARGYRGTHKEIEVFLMMISK